jgi:hypothetical protein
MSEGVNDGEYLEKINSCQEVFCLKMNSCNRFANARAPHVHGIDFRQKLLLSSAQAPAPAAMKSRQELFLPP